jgi:hypothetical protein
MFSRILARESVPSREPGRRNAEAKRRTRTDHREAALELDHPWM